MVVITWNLAQDGDFVPDLSLICPHSVVSFDSSFIYSFGVDGITPFSDWFALLFATRVVAYRCKSWTALAVSSENKLTSPFLLA
jgi:hypothetical protein